MRESSYPTTRGHVFEPGRFSDFLRNRHLQNTSKSVAAEIGASPRTVESWLAGASTPSALWLVRMIAVYGPEFLASIMTAPPAWLDGARMAQDRAEIARELEALAQRQRALEARKI